MILIYAHKTSSRLQYISHYLFRELMGIDSVVSNDASYFNLYEGIKINYGTAGLAADEFHIPHHHLLFESGIQQQDLDVFTVNNKKAFFKTIAGDFPFDIFAAAFYLITRYEEYDSTDADEYGRYPHTSSLAFKEGFLNQPLLNFWVQDLAKSLQQKFPGFEPKYPAFKFTPTYDIDIAYAYKYKGMLRNVGGFVKSPSLDRLKVLITGKSDPFDSYKWLDEIHHAHPFAPVYFFLVAEKNSRYDKNILPHKDIMWKLVKYHAKRYAIGLHPSWQSGDDDNLLFREKEYLADMSDVPVNRSRQHYIRFRLPNTYRRLIQLGMQSEYSMGYGSINGFRASVAAPFYWYDINREEQTFLRVYPFCYMDANSFYEQKFTAEQAYEEMLRYLETCKAAHGTMISIWHNNFLGTAAAFKSWRAAYERFIAGVPR